MPLQQFLDDVVGDSFGEKNDNGYHSLSLCLVHADGRLTMNDKVFSCEFLVDVREQTYNRDCSEIDDLPKQVVDSMNF